MSAVASKSSNGIDCSSLIRPILKVGRSLWIGLCSLQVAFAGADPIQLGIFSEQSHHNPIRLQPSAQMVDQHPINEKELIG